VRPWSKSVTQGPRTTNSGHPTVSRLSGGEQAPGRHGERKQNREMPEEGPVRDVPVIAMVDDDASLREALERFLGTCGFRVRSFASGEELLESSELGFISCLLLDLAMPGVSGLEVQQQLRARRLQIPTVFVTAHADDEVERHLVAAGAIAILPKPVDQQMLLRLVQNDDG